MLRNELTHDIAALVVADDFYVPRHAAVWRAIVRLADAQEPIDPVTLEHALQSSGELGLVGGLEALGKLADTATGSLHAMGHARLVAKLSRRRQLVRAALEIAETGMGAVDDEDAFADAAERQILAAGARKVEDSYESAAEGCHEMLVDIQEHLRGRDPVTGITTGLTDLDLALGGLEPGRVYVIAGRPGEGKSALAGCIARAASDGRNGKTWPSLYISMEMPTREMRKRQVYGIAYRKTRDPKLADRIKHCRPQTGDSEKLIAATTALHHSRMSMKYATGITITQIASLARKWHRSACQDGPGVLVIDYLALVRPPAGLRKTANREQEVASVCRATKELAGELGIPILLLAQVSRAATNRQDKRPDLSDLRESGAIEADADVVIFVHRPAMYLPEGSKEHREQYYDADLLIRKNRDRECCTVRAAYIGSCFYFQDRAHSAASHAA